MKSMFTNLVLSGLIFGLLILPSSAAWANSKPTGPDLTAVVQAVEDEIYDYGYEKDFVNIGSTGAITSPTDVPLYISAELYDDSHGIVIYKFMPFGEIQRRFAIRPDGLVVLLGKPLNRFPATQPDTNTLYLRDEDVCAFKQKAITISFTVDPFVSQARRREAAKRQQIRVGYSQYLEKAKKNNHQ